MKKLNKPAVTILVFITLIFTSERLCAQEFKPFKGRVININDSIGSGKLPVIGLSETGVDTTITDSEGYFIFKDGAKLRSIKINTSGYQPFEKEITPDSSGLTIHLKRQYFVRDLSNHYLNFGEKKLVAPNLPIPGITFLPVEITAFATRQKILESPGPVALLQNAELNRFSGSSLVSAVSTVPGVRLEERAPGSYRISIRGSTLRAPFGVRNVKVYLNNIPFTEANGNTFLNLLDPAIIGSVEILKAHPAACTEPEPGA